MSTVDEVLATAEVVDAVCVIDGETRIISVPNEYKELGVESDENVTRIRFQCPKIVGDNIDLTEYNLYINYRNAGNKLNSYLVEDVTVTGDTINFSWLLSRHVTESPGTISYIVCAKKSDYTGVINEWNTKVATGTVGVGLEATEEIEEQNIDIIEQILRSIVELENNDPQTKPNVVKIELPADAWVEEGTIYKQTVSISSATSSSLIELKPSQEQLQELLTSGVSLMTANDSGTVTVFSIGGVPASDYSIQAIVSEVNVVETPASYGNLVLSVESLTVEEGGSDTFTVVLNSAPSVNQIVYLAVSDNSRLSISPPTITFTSENWETPQTVTVSSVQDDDDNDDSIIVSLTSKNVDGKQLIVTVSDNYYVPELVTDGLVLHYDYINKVDDTSDTITDLAYGVTATGFSSMSKTANGIYGNGTEVWLTPDKTSEEYSMFRQAFAESAQKGFTVEAFGNFYARMFYFQKGYTAAKTTSLIHTATYPISASNTSGSLPGAGAPYLNSSGENVVKYKEAGKNFSTVENYDKYFHLAIVFNTDGTTKFYANGVDITSASDTAPDDFVSWDIDTIVNNFYLLCSASNRFSTSDASFLSEQRMYNRPLTQDEIIQNMEYTASKLGLLTF